jgi:hypothetical protein
VEYLPDVPGTSMSCDLSRHSKRGVAQGSIVQDLVQAGRPFGVRYTVSRAMHAGRRYRDARGAVHAAVGIVGGFCIHGLALGIVCIIAVTVQRGIGSLRSSTALMTLLYHTQ